MHCPTGTTTRTMHDIIQRADESLRSYIERFNRACLQMRDLDYSTAREAMIKGTRNERLRAELIQRQPKKLYQMITIAKNLIEVDEVDRPHMPAERLRPEDQKNKKPIGGQQSMPIDKDQSPVPF